MKYKRKSNRKLLSKHFPPLPPEPNGRGTMSIKAIESDALLYHPDIDAPLVKNWNGLNKKFKKGLANYYIDKPIPPSLFFVWNSMTHESKNIFKHAYKNENYGVYWTIKLALDT